jgi:hypothetical protein
MHCHSLQFLAKNSQSASVGVGELQFPVAEPFLEDSILGHEVVHLLLQNASETHRQPRCQELQWQQKHRTLGLVILPVHLVPFTPFRAHRKLIATFVNPRDSSRFSPILFWHQTRSVWKLREWSSCTRPSVGGIVPNIFRDLGIYGGRKSAAWKLPGFDSAFGARKGECK